MASAQREHVREEPRPDPTPRWNSTTPYHQLQPRQIRLLQIGSLQCEPDEILSCTLSVHDLDTLPPFTALSYTWGVPHHDISGLRTDRPSAALGITCNGNEGHVGENLYDFLVHCAHDKSQDLQGYWWIDALAINQGDIQERCEQVKLMSEIYQKAIRVVVWLGPEDKYTEPAVNLMIGLLHLGDERLDLYHTDVREDHPNDLLDSSNWQALAQFFQREWFNRAWIIQEVVLANSVTLLCGRFSISWATLSLFSQFVAVSSWTILLKNSAKHGGPRAISLGHNTPARLAAAQKTWLSDHDDKFLFALIRARSSNSENARDKVYSQLGLGNANINPDYRVSVKDVYITAARYILQQSKSLFLLTCVEGEDFQIIPGLPSWVPDWSVKKTLGLRVTGYPDFNAAPDIPKQQELTVDGDGRHVLKIRAFKLDDIIEAGETKPELRQNLHTSSFWKMISALDEKYAATGQDRDEAVWRALITNREDGGTPSKPINPRYPALQEPLGSSFRNWVLWRYVEASGPPTSFPTPSSILPGETEILQARARSRSDAAYIADLERQASLYDTHYCHASNIRTFCARKGYFGVGTQCLRKNDTVWIVPGCRVPLILRSVEARARYRLVGGAYVHGFMNGEALKEVDVAFAKVSLE